MLQTYKLKVIFSYVFPSAAVGEPTSSGEASTADPNHMIEDGEEGEEAVATETISKEEAAERLMVGQASDNQTI